MAWREAKISGEKSNLHDKCTTKNENTLLIKRLIGCFAVRTGYEPNPLYLYISIRYIPCKLIVTI